MPTTTVVLIIRRFAGGPSGWKRTCWPNSTSCGCQLEELRDWFSEALAKAFADVTEYHRRQMQAVEKRRAEIKSMQDRLVNGHLNGIIDEAVFQTKSAELKCLEAEVRESAEAAGTFEPAEAERVLRTFDFSQNAAEE